MVYGVLRNRLDIGVQAPGPIWKLLCRRLSTGARNPREPHARLRMKIIVSGVLPRPTPRGGLCAQEVTLLAHPGTVEILHFTQVQVLAQKSTL